MDAILGMAIAGLIFWFIVVATGVTLGLHRLRVETAQDAAPALAPLAGQFTALVFGVGLLASASLAEPVLAGTSAYVVAEAFGWRRGLGLGFSRASRFYLALLASLTIRVGLTFLIVSSIVGGLATPVTRCLMLLVARDWKVMRKHRIGPCLAIAGYAVTATVTVASIAYLWQTYAPSGQ